ncbi:Atu4866 domain-containing protein [Kitasatospora sp. NPDC101801]|uniref:Atu4866 domain-containing protein n=1 Tax=Kitasatospora sp. NPDC101801 TaxID=3364103 RepID=UPI00382512BD
MKSFLRLVTVTALTAASLAATLTACGADGPENAGAGVAAVVSSAPPAPAPAASGSAAGADGGHLGVWANDSGSLRLELRADGTFTEDYNGKKAAYEGRYTVEGGVLGLRAGSGASADGTVTADAIRISGESLKRQG